MTDTNGTSPARKMGPTYREVRAALVSLWAGGVPADVRSIVGAANYSPTALNMAGALTELHALVDNGEVTLSQDVGGNILARFDGVVLVFPDGRRGFLTYGGRALANIATSAPLTTAAGEQINVEVVAS